jgi:hypothetical protein
MMTETQWDTARTQKSVVFTPQHNNLVTVQADRSGVRLWNPERGKQLTALTATSDGDPWTLEGDTLTNFGPGVTRTVRLDPDMWFRTLCAAADRPFTDEELVTSPTTTATRADPAGDGRQAASAVKPSPRHPW